MKISIETEEELNNAGELIDSVDEVAIGLALSKEANLEKIFSLIRQNQSILVISIYDDYLHPEDGNTRYFVKRISQVAPDLKINWVSACAIDGRHGR